MSYARAAAMRGRDPANPSERAKSNGLYRQRIERGGEISNTITTVQKDSLIYLLIESAMTRTKLNRYVWYCYRIYEKRVGTDKAREEVSRIFDITVMEKERIKDSACDLNTVSDSAGQKISEILIKWGIYKDWMRVMLYEYIDAPHSKSEVIRFLSDITPIRKAIRKLTERECFRLMDVNESDIDKIQDSGVSRSQQYKMAGNSIVVACMEGIFFNLFSTEEQETLTLF